MAKIHRLDAFRKKNGSPNEKPQAITQLMQEYFDSGLLKVTLNFEDIPPEMQEQWRKRLAAVEISEEDWQRELHKVAFSALAERIFYSEYDKDTTQKGSVNLKITRLVESLLISEKTKAK